MGLVSIAELLNWVHGYEQPARLSHHHYHNHHHHHHHQTFPPEDVTENFERSINITNDVRIFIIWLVHLKQKHRRHNLPQQWPACCQYPQREP